MIWGWIIAALSVVGSAYYQKKMMEDMQSKSSGFLINKAGASEGLRLIYGTRRVGATKAWKGTSRIGGTLSGQSTSQYDKVVRMGSGYRDGTREKTDYLHRLDVWGQGPIDNINSFTIDGDLHTDSRWQDGKNHPYYSSLSFYGSETQQLPTQLVNAHSELTSSMQGKGVAFTWNRFLYRSQLPQYQGEPQCVAEVRGLKIWDPRTNPTNSNIKAWSNNPALVLLDYLMADYGKNLSESDIHIQSFIDAANVCDSTVTTTNVAYHTGPAQYMYDWRTSTYVYVETGDEIPGYRWWMNNTTTSQQRFQCDIILEPKDTTQSNVNKILKTMKGSLPYSQGQYKLVLEDTASSVKSFDADNILGTLDVSFADRSKRLNRVTVKFPNRNKDFEDDLVSYPELDSLQYSNYYAEDQSEELHDTIELEGVTDYYQALDLAEFIVKDSRTQMFVQFKAQPEAITLEAGDIISLTHETPGWTNKEFRVRELTINSDLTVNIKAQEYDASIYNWGAKDPEPTVAWEFINPFVAPTAVTGLTLTQINDTKNDGSVQTNLRVSWDAIESDGQSVDRILVGHREHTTTVDAPYTSWATIPAGDTSFDIQGLNDTKDYDVAVYYKDIIGSESDYTEATIDLVPVPTSIDGVVADVSTAQADADAAASAASAAQSAANTAQAAADAAQATADNAGDSQAVQAAQAAADAAQAAADLAQQTADQKQTSAQVLAAIAADTTVIDGARITTGTINAARISLAGKNISELNNDSGFTNDAAANAAAAAASSAAAAASTANAAAATAQAAADAAQSDVDALPSDIQAAQDAADAAQAAADAASALAASKQTAAEVATAIANDTTVIDGSRILTGTLDGASITATTDVIVGSGAETAGLSGDSSDEFRIWSGGATGDVANFSVDKDGQVIANAITISDENGSVMFDSQSGFSQAAKSQILEDAINTTSTFSFDQSGNSGTPRTITLLEQKAVTITCTFTVKGTFSTATSSAAARALQPSTISQNLKVNGTSIGSNTLTAVYNGTPTTSTYNVIDRYLPWLTNYGHSGNYYSSLNYQSKTSTFTTTLAAGTHTLQSVITQNVGNTIEDGAVSINVSINDGGQVISLGSSTVTISNSAPTSVGNTSHGHIFYTY